MPNISASFKPIIATLGKVGPVFTALGGISSALTIAYYSVKFLSGGVTGPSAGEKKILQGIKDIKTSLATMDAELVSLASNINSQLSELTQISNINSVIGNYTGAQSAIQAIFASYQAFQNKPKTITVDSLKQFMSEAGNINSGLYAQAYAIHSYLIESQTALLRAIANYNFSRVEKKEIDQTTSFNSLTAFLLKAQRYQLIAAQILDDLGKSYGGDTLDTNNAKTIRENMAIQAAEYLNILEDLMLRNWDLGGSSKTPSDSINQNYYNQMLQGDALIAGLYRNPGMTVRVIEPATNQLIAQSISSGAPTPPGTTSPISKHDPANGPQGIVNASNPILDGARQSNIASVVWEDTTTKYTLLSYESTGIWVTRYYYDWPAYYNTLFVKLYKGKPMSTFSEVDQKRLDGGLVPETIKTINTEKGTVYFPFVSMVDISAFSFADIDYYNSTNWKASKAFKPLRYDSFYTSSKYKETGPKDGSGPKEWAVYFNIDEYQFSGNSFTYYLANKFTYQKENKLPKDRLKISAKAHYKITANDDNSGIAEPLLKANMEAGFKVWAVNTKKYAIKDVKTAAFNYDNNPLNFSKTNTINKTITLQPGETYSCSQYMKIVTDDIYYSKAIVQIPGNSTFNGKIGIDSYRLSWEHPPL